ncbi:MAG: phosphoribosyltransferase family protein [Anaerolineaceae bacterium]|nr:phosphoribosyltransferase family protein [Anaerolineaceae bacterium]
MSMGEALSNALIQRLNEFGWWVDLVTPVPLSQGRYRERGYNQSALLAYPVALAHGIRYSSKALQRVRETASQINLTAEERHRNVLGAFAAESRIVAGKKVLVIDDVATTGATIGACAEALLKAGAVVVYGLTLARAVRQN